MKREHLIFIAIALFVLAGCIGTVFLGVLLWPAQQDVVETNKKTGDTWEPPVVPKAQREPASPSYTQPRIAGQSPTPKRSQSALDFLPGVWQCVQGSKMVGNGAVLQFMESTGGAAGLAYLAADSQASGGWTELSYQLGVEGYLTVCATRVPEGRVPVTSRFWVQFPDEVTMLMYSAEEGDESLPPAVLQRVQ